MRKSIECIVYLGENHYVGECLDFPVVTQSKSIDQTIVNLRKAIALHIEDENLELLGFVKSPDIDIKVETGKLVDVQ